MVVGALVASVVKINVIAKISAGDNTIKLQEMFDKVMPGLFSFLVTVAVYKILKKTNGKHAPLLILAIMVLCILLTALGILG
jgi:PTS system mannose-specific IID component